VYKYGSILTKKLSKVFRSSITITVPKTTVVHYSIRRVFPSSLASAAASPPSVVLATRGVRTVLIPSVYGIRLCVLYLHTIVKTSLHHLYSASLGIRYSVCNTRATEKGCTFPLKPVYGVRLCILIPARIYGCGVTKRG